MKFVKSAALVLALTLLSAATVAEAAPGDPAPAGTAAPTTLGDFNGIGMGLVIIGAGLGIGRLAASALEGMARQPEMAGTIQLNMIIAAALIEGATFAAIIFIYLIS